MRDNDKILTREEKGINRISSVMLVDEDAEEPEKGSIFDRILKRKKNKAPVNMVGFFKLVNSYF